MLGTGPLYEGTIEFARTLGVLRYLNAPGQVGVQEYIENSSALVHTSAWEGFCRSVLEATYVNLPVFAYRVKGVIENPAVNAVADVGDVVGLADLLRYYFGSAINGASDVNRRRTIEDKLVDGREAWSMVDRFCRHTIATAGTQ